MYTIVAQNPYEILTWDGHKVIYHLGKRYRVVTAIKIFYKDSQEIIQIFEKYESAKIFFLNRLQKIKQNASKLDLEGGFYEDSGYVYDVAENKSLIKV